MKADELADFAALAFCQATEYHLILQSGSRDLGLLENALTNYDKALKLLRQHLLAAQGRPSEAAAATSFSMSVFDLLISNGFQEESNHRASFCHLEVSQACLVSQANLQHASPLIRGMFQDTCRLEFIRACGLGRLRAPAKSEFRAERWEIMAPFSLQSRSWNWNSLQVSAQLMTVRLADLIATVQELRLGTVVEPADAVELAEALLSCENLEAENATLHQLNVQQTRDVESRQVVPYSFDFESSHWSIATHYWGAMLMVVRLSLLIDGVLRTRYGIHWLQDSRKQRLEDVQERLVSNILMSVQYAFDRSLLAKLQVIHPLNIVWATLAGRETILRGRSTAELRTWILERFQVSGIGFLRHCTEEDLDRSTDIFGS